MWICPNCGERLENQFSACWKCLSDKDGNITSVDKTETSEKNVSENLLKLKCPLCNMDMQAGFFKLSSSRNSSLNWYDKYRYSLVDDVIHRIKKKKIELPTEIVSIIKIGLFTPNSHSIREAWRCKKCSFYCFKD